MKWSYNLQWYDLLDIQETVSKSFEWEPIVVHILENVALYE